MGTVFTCDYPGQVRKLILLAPVWEIAKELFTNLKYIVVDDGHRLHKAFEELDWKSIPE